MAPSRMASSGGGGGVAAGNDDDGDAGDEPVPAIRPLPILDPASARLSLSHAYTPKRAVPYVACLNKLADKPCHSASTRGRQVEVVIERRAMASIEGDEGDEAEEALVEAE